jgi:hypothetical protein
VLPELKIIPIVKFKIAEINGFNRFSEWAKTTFNYELSTM